MDPIDCLQDINVISREILEEFDKEEPSVEVIQEALERRDQAIAVLEEQSSSCHRDDAAAGEQTVLVSLFRDFSLLNKTLQRSLQESLDQHRKSLAQADKRRKAEDEYRIFNKQNNSYLK